MKKTFLTIMLAAGIGSACAATTAAWEFSSGVPSEQFMTGSGIKLEGWSISSAVNSTASYTDWATVTGGDRNISTQTVGMWLDLSSLGSGHYLQLWRDGFSPRPPACLQRGRHVYFQENGRSGPDFHHWAGRH